MKCGRKLKGTTLQSRILEQIKIASNGCWVWTGLKRASGKARDKKNRVHKLLPYGVLKVNGKGTSAHRASWMAFRGEIPKGKMVCHGCDNPPCVNPDHLFIGTNQTNMDDCVSKNRQAAGERHPKHKLTSEIVAKMKKLYRPWDRKRSVRVLAEKFGVGQTVAFYAIKGRRWKN